MIVDRKGMKIMRRLYHGSEKIIEKSIYGQGEKYNDYGLGFYCTDSIDMAKEWGVKKGTDGYANCYELDCNGLDMVFRSIVTQLAKSNEKFMYGAVKEGARARDFEEAIEWLVSAGMLNRIYNVSKLEHPLSAFDKLDQFKLFLFDTGLLKQMAGVDNSAILLKSTYQFKGPLTENYVLQQLRGQFEVAEILLKQKWGN